ncbi:DUF1364 domain-containing protein [Alteromonadaceae bacterium M269]|nr:DUF1364 domain-containing protein [Alteromonadaceae bacterium M269]
MFNNGRVKSTKLRNSARGQECQLRIPGICNHNPETTVLAHVGEDSGMGMKASDLEAAFGCSACHDAIDGKVKTGFSKTELDLFACRGAERTRKLWVSSDLIKVA